MIQVRKNKETNTLQISSNSERAKLLSLQPHQVTSKTTETLWFIFSCSEICKIKNYEPFSTNIKHLYFILKTEPNYSFLFLQFMSLAAVSLHNLAFYDLICWIWKTLTVSKSTTQLCALPGLEIYLECTYILIYTYIY